MVDKIVIGNQDYHPNSRRWLRIACFAAKKQRRKAVAALIRKTGEVQVREAREEKGWSQNELAKRSGVNQATINRVEAGAKLTEKQGRKLAETLEVGVEWILQGTTSHRDYPVHERLINWLCEFVNNA